MNDGLEYIDPVIVQFDIEGWKREYNRFENPWIIRSIKDIEKYLSDEGGYPYILWFNADTFESLEALGIYVESSGFVKRIAYALLVALGEPGNFSSEILGRTKAYCVATNTKRELLELKMKIQSASVYRTFIEK